jgi:hypothetical protein
MTLKKREIILAISIAALLGVLAIYWFWPTAGESFADLSAKRDKLAVDLENMRTRVRQAHKATQRLAAWQLRALPADAESARSLYQNWLRELVDRAKFRNAKVNAVEGQSRRDVFTLFDFDIQCQGTLEQLTRFLYDFYSAGHLHKIRTLTIKPVENSKNLDLNISVEAMSLPGSAEKDSLSAEPGNRLKLSSWEDYKNAIVGRNLFAAYSPPKTSKDKNEVDSNIVSTSSDFSQYATLTAIVEADGVAEAWLSVRNTGETLEIREGEQFKIGPVLGKIMRIGHGEIDIEIDGKRITVGYGNSQKM